MRRLCPPLVVAWPASIWLVLGLIYMVRFRMMPAVQAGQKRNCNRIKPGSEIQLNTYLDHCFRAWGCPDADSPNAEEPQDFSIDTETKVLLIAGRAKGMSDSDQEVQGGGVGRQVSVSAQEWLTDAYEAMSDYSKFKKAATRHRYRIVVTAGLGLAVIVAVFSIGGSKSDYTAGVSSLVRSVLLVPDCDPKTLFSARPPSLHQLLKTYAVLAMLADHYAKVFGPLKDTVLLTLPAQAGGALLFYFLVGANSNRASYTSGVVRMLLLQVFLESVCNMPVMTFDTLFTLSLIRLVVVSLTDRAVDGPVSNPTVSVPSWADENLVIAHAIAMGALFLLHIPFGPDGCRMLAYPASFFYGAAGALLAAFNRLIGEQSEKDQQDAYGVRRLAWFWLAVGTLISNISLSTSTLPRLNQKNPAHMSAAACAICVHGILVAVLATYSHRRIHMGSGLLGQCISVVMRLISRFSLAIYAYHILACQALAAPQRFAALWARAVSIV